jgi:hypothetical protein
MRLQDTMTQFLLTKIIIQIIRVYVLEYHCIVINVLYF